MAPTLHSVMEETIDAVLDAMEACTDISERRAVFLTLQGEPVPRFRDMGERLHRLGGMQAMMEVALALETRLAKLAVPMWNVDLRELDMCWNGIGDWQS
jgi:hypothetical protein